jgi:hypothetical protein
MKPDIAGIEAKMENLSLQAPAAPGWTRTLLALWAAALLLSAAACAPTTVEQDYGRSVHHNIAQQLVNPRAGLDTTPAVGLPPTAAANEMDHYNKTFKGEEKKSLEMKLTTPSY